MEGDASSMDTMANVDELWLNERERPKRSCRQGSCSWSRCREAEAKRLAEQRAREEAVAAQQSKPVVEPKTTPRIPTPETGIVYKVQMMHTGHREVGKNLLLQHPPPLHGSFQRGAPPKVIKYVTGRFGSYSEARDQRVGYVAAGHQFPGPFVTAYNNGDRMTVQEALLLSNQKWVQ